MRDFTEDEIQEMIRLRRALWPIDAIYREFNTEYHRVVDVLVERLPAEERNKIGRAVRKDNGRTRKEMRKTMQKHIQNWKALPEDFPNKYRCSG